MAQSVRASDEGLKIIDKARVKKGWAKTAKVWADLAYTSSSTLRRFWDGIKIQSTTFQSICKAVEVLDWESIADIEDLALNTQICSKRLSFAIAGSIDEIDKHKLKAITALLRQLSGDASIEIVDAYEGSIKLILGGSPQGLERIEELFKSGQFSEIAGTAIQDVHHLNKDELARIIKERGGDAADWSLANLRGADLRGADLRGANLLIANLHEADLSEANLGLANLRTSDLRRTDLRGADLLMADLCGADLREANLRGASLNGVSVYRTQFSFAKGLSENRVRDLMQKGAIFEDASGEESLARSPVPSGRR